MEISSDAIVFWRHGFIELNLTIVTTWVIMAALTLISWLATRNLTTGPDIGRWQNLLESIVSTIREQIAEVTRRDPSLFMPFLGTIFLFVALSNLLTILPFYQPPTGSLSTTAALAICVFVAVPVYGIADRGLLGYLRTFAEPTPIMLPFNVIGEIARTLALAVRLFGNIMSGTMIGAILIAITPFIFPVIMHLLGLLTGMVQAYIFAVLAAVYIASGMRAREQTEGKHKQKHEENTNG